MWRGPDYESSSEILNAIAGRCCPVRNDSDFYEGEGECTSERVAGQFSIFGAVEEKARTIRGGEERMK